MVLLHRRGNRGDLAGSALERVPSYLCRLEEWLEEHPDSEILAWHETSQHSDPRHGHGSWFYFGCRGPHPHCLATLLDGCYDDRLSEHELVLGVCQGKAAVAFPLSAIHAAGCVVHAEVGGEPVVVWARSHGSAWMACFSRRLDGQDLEFEKDGSGFRDRKSGSRFSVEGLAVSGALSGQRLKPFDFVPVKWSAWAGFLPHTEVWAAAPRSVARVPLDGFHELLARLAAAGYAATVEAELLGGCLPPAARRGLVAHVGGDRLRVLRFSGARQAADYAASKLLIPRDRYLTFFPGEEPSDLTRRAISGGVFVVESDPEVQYADVESLERLPEEEIAYSALLDDAKFRQAVRSDDSPAGDGPSFTALFTALDKAGFEVRRVKPMLRHWLRPGAVDGYSAEIRGDRFLVYEFVDAKRARAYRSERHHTIDAGRFVLRSDPPGQYHVASEGTLERPVEDVDWSELLNEPAFSEAVAVAAGGG